MAEYIEREAIAKLFDSECRGECVVCPYDDRGDCTLMNQIPTADVQPVKHGRWIIRDNPGTGWYRVTCSECGEDVTSTAPCIGFFPNAKVTWNYCPDCGARMDGESNG